MPSSSPAFWWKKPGLLCAFFKPFSWIYGYFAARNLEKVAPLVDLPVLCIGNFTLGGTGKTPTAIALAKAAQKKGLRPGIVSRGYGSSVESVHIVDADSDRARDVGDEPLLLALHAPVAIGADRWQGALKLKEEGCDFVLMDDGFQSRRLLSDYALIVVDGLRGFGNGEVFPAGPLRAPLNNQFVHTDSVLVIGDSEDGQRALRLSARANKRLAQARLVPSTSRPIEKGERFLIFSGIGNPKKFERSVVEMGGVVVERREYADHYFFSDADIKDILASAREQGIKPATTAKDYARLKTDGKLARFADLTVFDIDVVFEDEDFCSSLIDEVLLRYKKRQLGL